MWRYTSSETCTRTCIITKTFKTASSHQKVSGQAILNSMSSPLAAKKRRAGGRTPDLEVAELHIDPLSSHNEPSGRSGLHVKPISNREEPIERKVILR
jgi:hypothetical protein